jgi:CubicO group peptidase (beta-lactamase class C family)
MATVAPMRVGAVEDSNSGRPAGLVHLRGHSLADSSGPFLGLGASYFQALRDVRDDRARLNHNLALLSTKGFNYARVFSMVAWDGLEIAPVTFTNRQGRAVAAWPDYWRQFHELLELAEQNGLRVEITIFADAQRIMPSKSARLAHLDKILAGIAGHESQVMHLEVANEAWQNGFPGAQGIADLREFAAYIAARTSVLVAITSNDDTSDSGIQALYRGSAADLATVHFSRDTRTVEVGWLPVRDSYRVGQLVDIPPVMSNEPIGPGSSVASESDPIKLFCAAAFAYIAGLPGYVFHARAGIYGYEQSSPPDGQRLRFEDAAGMDAFRHIRQLLPPDLASWTRNDGLEPQAPFIVYCNGQPNRYWPSVSQPTHGCARNIGGGTNGEFICLPMGILAAGATFEARRAVNFTVYNPLTGSAVTNLSLLAGAAFTLPPGPGAYVIKGAYQTNSSANSASANNEGVTRVSIANGRWHFNRVVTYAGTPAEGLLLNVRLVNATFEDRNRPEFNPESNTDEFIHQIPSYVGRGVRAFTLNLQGGSPGYEGAENSAYEADGSLRAACMNRVRRVIEAVGRHGAVVILGCFYQRQDQFLNDETAVRFAVTQVATWLKTNQLSNVVLEIANEYGHGGYQHALLRQPEGQVKLIELAKQTAPGLLVSTSGLGDGKLDDVVARASDFLLVHFNNTALTDVPPRIAALKRYGKPIVCNEDEKTGEQGAAAARVCVANGASWGLMLESVNQRFPFAFHGPADDSVVYAALKELSMTKKPSLGAAEPYFPPPESAGGWRKLETPEDIKRLGGMDPAKLKDLAEWLKQSDDRDFAADVIRHGYIVLEVERGNRAKTDARRVASVSKAICATVLAIASEQSQRGLTPRKMTFDDPAFDFIPWGKPLSDPRKAAIKVKQLFNHTSGICPEATGAENDGSWAYILGHTGDERTARLAFAPGAGCGYSTHALSHAALVCETVTGLPYDQFAIQALYKPLGIERWWFQYFDGGEGVGRHPSHGAGLPARDLARIAYCMLHEGRWNGRQVIPQWFVEQTAQPTHHVKTPEMRWKLNPEVFSHGWELPARHWPESGRDGRGIPADAREKPGSGGQIMAFVPSLDLVITRQTGSSGDWAFEEYLRRACAAVVSVEK